MFSCDGNVATPSSSEDTSSQKVTSKESVSTTSSESLSSVEDISSVNDTSSQEVTSSESVSSVAVTSSEEIVSAESEGSTSSQLEKIYLELDETKSKEYNDAIKAYNTFLNYECVERNEEDDAKYQVGLYALFDVNHDEIPELLTWGSYLCVFSYQERKIVSWYEDIQYAMSGSRRFLENGAILTIFYSTGTDYSYKKFDDKGVSFGISFRSEDFEGGKYYFEGKEVSKEEYDELTKDYFEAMKKEADLTWYEYSLAK